MTDLDLALAPAHPKAQPVPPFSAEAPAAKEPTCQNAE